MRRLLCILAFGIGSCIGSVADNAAFYLVSKGGWWHGPYRPEQWTQLDPVKKGESADLIWVCTNQPYHALFQEMGYRRIDLRRTGSSFFELSVRCRDRSGCFLVDSGSGNEMLYETFADACGQEHHTITNTTLGAVRLAALKETRTENGIALSFPEYFVVRPDRKRTFQPDGLVPNRWESFGIIGNGFLREHKAILDYDAEALFILRTKSSAQTNSLIGKKMASLGYKSIPLRWDAANRCLRVKVGIGTNTTDAVVDTGASATSVDRRLAERFGMKEITGTRQRFEGESTISWAPTDQKTDPQVGMSTSHELSVGEFPIRLRQGIMITNSGIESRLGDSVFVGNNLLAVYGAVLDFGNDVLYLRTTQTAMPNKAPEDTARKTADLQR